MPRYIDIEPLVEDYDKSIEWLQNNVQEMSMEEFVPQMTAMQTGKAMLLEAPEAEVRPVVFCRNCKYGKMVDEEHYKCEARYEPFKMFPTDFCSLGEKKSEREFPA